MKCLHCGSSITIGFKFCSRSCSVSYNNRLTPKRIKKVRVCSMCDNVVRRGMVACSDECMSKYKLKVLEGRAKDGLLSSRSLKRFLLMRDGEKCSSCGWSEINKTTGLVPVELDHIDGDSSNNELSNLRILCPNCHSLTPTFRALNAGRGRLNRKRESLRG